MDCVFASEALSKTYGSGKALDGLCMHIPAGSVYGFVGQNGAGKTTLMRLLCGLQVPTSGEYRLFGTAHTDRNIAKARSRIGALVESPAVYSDMSAEENLKQQYRILGVPSFVGISNTMKLVGLEGTGKKPVRNLSQGMRQKLGIAMALAGNPDFVVLDEPLNGLDPQGIIDFRALILKLNQERHITFLISSHYLNELTKLATHFGFIHHGRMVKETTAAELERACLQCTRVIVSHTDRLARALDRMQLKYLIHSDTQADIYAPIHASQLMAPLLDEQCELHYCWDQNESIETYFLHLIGGEADA